mmetsp:Transcript_20355/g.29548  ORF Transcript_20355/g.29548 Transcript_20355/m.29548 type:complete len:84 (+) Transcript_20355:255-506(+)
MIGASLNVQRVVRSTYPKWLNIYVPQSENLSRCNEELLLRSVVSSGHYFIQKVGEFCEDEQAFRRRTPLMSKLEIASQLDRLY